MTTAPRYDVTVDVFLPGMFLSLGHVQAESYWAQPAATPPLLRWQQLGARKINWKQPGPQLPVDWK